jgi:hypothetical protein
MATKINPIAQALDYLITKLAGDADDIVARAPDHLTQQGVDEYLLEIVQATLKRPAYLDHQPEFNLNA